MTCRFAITGTAGAAGIAAPALLHDELELDDELLLELDDELLELAKPIPDAGAGSDAWGGEKPETGVAPGPPPY